MSNAANENPIMIQFVTGLMPRKDDRGFLPEGAKDDLIDRRHYEVQVPASKLAPEFAKWITDQSALINDTGDIEKRIPLRAYHELFELFVPELNSGEETGRVSRLCHPVSTHHGSLIITVTPDYRWITAEISSAQMFFHRPKKGAPYEWVPIPDNCSVDYTWSITATYAGKSCRASSPVGAKTTGLASTNIYAWPWILLDPELWVVLNELAELRSNSDNNPLSGLIKSPQPYKTLGHQLANQLGGIELMLLDVLKRVR